MGIVYMGKTAPGHINCSVVRVDGNGCSLVDVLALAQFYGLTPVIAVVC